MKRFYGVEVIASIMLLAANYSSAEGLSPPPYEVQNSHQVNVASGHVSPTLEDVSIGGSMGLTHSISSYTSNFVNIEGGGAWGYNDKFRGGLYKRLHHPRSTIAEELYVLTVYADGFSADFLINPDGHTFTAYGDKRYTLEFVINPDFKPGFIGFILTKPDGTTFFYKSSTVDHDYRNYNSHNSLGLNEIQYPNGFTITINHNFIGQWAPISSVRTNTGFQLKYVYVINKTPAYLAPSTNLPARDSVGWSSLMPKYLWAINNAVDYCSPLPNDFTLPASQACPSFTRPWPTVTYDWPNGMPRAMYLEANVFKVTDASGGVTEYRHTPFSTYLKNVQDNPNIFLPRLTSIKSASSDLAVVNYSYINKGIPGPDNGGYFPTFQAGPRGQLSSSWIGDNRISYSVGAEGQYEGYYSNSCGGYGGGYHSIDLSMHSVLGMYKIDAWDKTVDLERGGRQSGLSCSEQIGRSDD